MGCDITMHIEYRKMKGSEWRHFSNIGIWRNYYLFSALGYSRIPYEIGPVPIKSALTGAVSMETLLSFESNEQNHDPSWLTLDELNECLEFYNKLHNPLQVIDVEINVVRDIMKSFHENGWESRIIFWFDN